MPKSKKRLKVFLCYARENQPLMDDFYDRFNNHNERDMEILYDRNAESRNMHEVFHEFASQCDVAVLLVNARFINPERYPNLNEVPLLLERKRAGEVIVVGVRFSNVSDMDLEEWNVDGEVNFFSLTNNDLLYTRKKKSGDEAYLRKFAIYEQVHKKDRNDYHKQLRERITKIIDKKSIIANHAAAAASKPPLRDLHLLEKMVLNRKVC